MDIKCNINPYYFNTSFPIEAIHFRGVCSNVGVAERVGACVCSGVKENIIADKFVKRPVATKSATGLFGFITKGINSISNYAHNYQKNLKHTYDHKIIFGLIEKELFGYNSIDSITHDLDKLILYSIGFPKSFVSSFHRKHSVHHTESGKKMNLRSMICDNIASSPEFKPEKKKSLRDYYTSSKELQNVQGFGELLEKYNYGENLNFDSIKAKKEKSLSGQKGFLSVAVKTLALLFTSVKSPIL